MKGCEQLLRRFRFDVDWISSRNCFHPSNALSENFHGAVPTLFKVFLSFPFLRKYPQDLKDKINDEWVDLINLKELLPLDIIEEQVSDSFWVKIKESTDMNGSLLFENLVSLSLDVLCVPESIASCERVFSKMNLPKTSIRNKLAPYTLRALLLASYYIEDQGRVFAFEPTSQMTKKTFNL